MNKFYKLIKPLFMVLVCFFLFPIISNAAATCPSDLMLKYTSMARNVNISHKILKYDENGNPIFEILFNNLTRGMLVVENDKNPYRKKGIQVMPSEGETVGNFSFLTTKSGIYNFKIWVRTKNCTAGPLAELNVTIPAYNKFYKDDRCKGYEQYNLCKKWSGYSGDEKKFANDLEEVKRKEEAKKNKFDEETPKPNKKWYKNISQIFVKYWWFFIAIIVIIIGVYYLIRQKQKKNEYNFKL